MIHTKSITSGFEHLFHLAIDKEILELGVFQLAMQLGRDLMAISIVFFMFSTLHYEIWQILFFFFLRQIPFFVMHPFITKFIEKTGIKHSISTKSFFSLIFYLILPLLLTENFELSMMVLMPVFIIRAFFQDTSNVAYDIFIAKHMNQKKQGGAMAWMQIAIMAGAVIAPIAGAIVTSFFGFDYVTYLGAFIMFIGGIVLLATPDEKFTVPYTPQKLVRDTFSRNSKYFIRAEFGRIFFDSILWILWPLFLIVTLGSLMSTGLVIGMASGAAMIVAFFVGKKLDNSKNKIKILKKGVYRSTILNFLRAVWLDPLVLSAIDALDRINSQTVKVPYNVEYYKWLHAKDTFERAHMARFMAELFYTATLFLFFTLFWILRDYHEPPNWIFMIIFSLGSIMMILTTQIGKVNREVKEKR